MTNALEMNNICKVYPNGVYANKSVNFSVKKGEIHALVGENGAGKSTLMKILFGLEQPDSGSIMIEGKEVKIDSPHDAITLGIGMVHQHFMLVDSLTVAENTALGTETKKGLFIDKSAISKKVKEISDIYNLSLNPDSIVGELSVGNKQRVEILKTLYRNASIIILDEPTAVLTPQETKDLFERLLMLKEQGHTIIFISHKLDEIKQITDRITILRQGKFIDTVMTCDVSEQEISNLMIGDEVELLAEKSAPNPTDTVLDLDGVNYTMHDGYQAIKDLSLRIRAGEIVGLAGIEGNGQKELVDIITGFLPYKGKADFFGSPIKTNQIANLRDRGLSYIPSDRMTKGSVLDMSIEENLLSNEIRIGHLKSKFPFLISKSESSEYADRLIKDFDVRTGSRSTQMNMLSGGNMQKVVVAREFSSKSNFVVADQPTRGIDILAADSIHRMLVEKREQGAAVLLVSADLQELINVSDSIVVIYGGVLVAYFPDASKVSQTELGTYMLGAKKMNPEDIRREQYEKNQ